MNTGTHADIFVTYALWLIVSAAWGATAFGFHRWSQFLAGVTHPFKLLARLSIIYSIVGLVIVGVGAGYSFFDADELWWMRTTRSVIGTVFAVSIAAAVNWIAVKAFSLPLPQKETLIEAVKAFSELSDVVHKTEN